MSQLGDRLLAVNDALNQAGVDRAFGGAIALAYCTGEPRATIDLDINVFVPVENHAEALAALPPEVNVSRIALQQIRNEGQARVWWGDTPLDLFFNTHGFHAIAATRAREVPFMGHRIPVLDCTTVAVFKVFFNRTKDWADLEAMFEAGQLDVDVVAAFVRDLPGEHDLRIGRLQELADD